MNTPAQPIHEQPFPGLPQVAGEAQFQALLESAPDAIVIVDDSGHMLLVNHQAARLFGYDRAALIGQPVELLLPERLRIIHARHRAAYTAAPRTRPMGLGLDLVARHADGSEVPVEISLSPLQTPEGMLITAVIRDISERRRAEAELRRQTAFVHLLQLAAVTANEASAPEAALQQVLDQICTEMGWPIGHIYLPSGDDQLVATSLWRLDNPQRFAPFRDATANTRIARGDGLVGQVFASGRPVWMTASSFVRAEAARQAGIQSGFAFPVLVGSEVVAVLEFFSDAAIAPDARLLEVLAHIGAQLGRVVERSRVAAELERQVQRRTAHLNALLQFSQELLAARSLEGMLQRALDHAMALVPEAQRGAIYLYEPANQRLALRASGGFPRLPALSLPTDQGLIGRAFAHGQLLIASDPAELATLLAANAEAGWLGTLDLAAPPSGAIAIPLIAQAQTIGVLLLLRTSGQGPFAREARATLEGLANLTAVAIRAEQSARVAATLSGQLADLEAQQQIMAERLTHVEAGMLQAARLAAVGQLAAAIAHEINNPLYAARNCLYLLAQEQPPNDSPYLEIAREQLTRIAGIIERMRDFYRPARGDLAPCDLNHLLEETLALAGLHTRHAAIQIIFTPAANLPAVLANTDQLRQVFLNLILNAIDAMAAGGTLTVRTVAGPTVAIAEVQDTGVGIPASIRAHLFEPFFTTKASGTGLGLSISAHIVTQHGGRIDVQSEEDHGTTFQVVLPYQPMSVSG